MKKSQTFLVAAALYFCLSAPVLAGVDVVTSREPLSYTLKQYGFILGMALVGGAVSWYQKVRKGEMQFRNFSALVGELTTSALAGLMAFYVCEYFHLDPLLTPCVVGVAGHMGTKAISMLEAFAEDFVRNRTNRIVGADK